MRLSASSDHQSALAVRQEGAKLRQSRATALAGLQGRGALAGFGKAKPFVCYRISLV